MWGIGPLELIPILILAVLLFGGRLPEIARAVGKGVAEFKKGLQEGEQPTDRHDRDQGSDDKPPFGPSDHPG